MLSPILGSSDQYRNIFLNKYAQYLQYKWLNNPESYLNNEMLLQIAASSERFFDLGFARHRKIIVYYSL